VIDSDYRGELLCALYNTGDLPISLPAGSKICQLIIEKIATPTASWSDELSETARGAGGFGSTGGKRGKGREGRRLSAFPLPLFSLFSSYPFFSTS
jgi:hypothetical protein